MDTLERLFGLKFHRYQEEALNAIQSKRDVLICQPTGSGKSLVFQSHPFYFHCSKTDATPQHSSLAELAKEMKCFVIVISPLNSLMEDQVNSLNAKGVEAIALDQCSKDSTILEVCHYPLHLGLGSDLD
ncbi:ATP-dependent DNA helicase RecQ-like [Clytia hemisphaerica]|uniref:ATP-dependent DNA helicase RecQ-like n=1 Tax=Clytia hemisphaerica TaxID=252671 RepID=UPI0034D670D3